MKISHSIFLVGIILVIIELLVIYADLGTDSKNPMMGLISENVFDKISTLYVFFIFILFFFGGMIRFFENGMDGNSLREYQQKMEQQTN